MHRTLLMHKPTPVSKILKKSRFFLHDEYIYTQKSNLPSITRGGYVLRGRDDAKPLRLPPWHPQPAASSLPQLAQQVPPWQFQRAWLCPVPTC